MPFLKKCFCIKLEIKKKHNRTHRYDVRQRRGDGYGQHRRPEARSKWLLHGQHRKEGPMYSALATIREEKRSGNEDPIASTVTPVTSASTPAVSVVSVN